MKRLVCFYHSGERAKRDLIYSLLYFPIFVIGPDVR